MVRFDEEDPSGAPVSVRDRDGESAASPPKRIFARRKSNSARHLPTRILLTDPERSTLAVLGKRLGRQGLEPVASAVKPDINLAWFRKLVAQKFDGSGHRLYPGRPPMGREITELIVRVARENSGWGYDRIAGAVENLGHHDFFTVEVLIWRGLANYYVLFFLHLETRRVTLAGITQHPNEEWMVQMAPRAIDPIDGALLPIRFVLHDRDTKFCAPFRDTLRSAGVRPLTLPAHSPNLNSFVERRVRSIKSECLSKLILFGEGALRRAVTQFVEHYHLECPHHGKGNQLLFPAPVSPPSPVSFTSNVRNASKCQEPLGGLLKFYQRAA